ncbi:MAG: VCBS repeat-containing protein, partial [candidate division WOR-3 bacterium]|nr:VCBS repeat-containing protein [candidate division WOR-3 bacterium]
MGGIIRKLLLLLFFVVIQLNSQLQLKRVAFLLSGTRIEDVVCADTDHDTLNEIIFLTLSPRRGEIWEHRPMTRYELVFADTSRYPYPPGIHTGNFKPHDVGDIDRDGLIDLVGPNFERANDSTYNVVTTQESPNYTSYPRNLSWWYRFAYNEVVSQPFYYPPDLDSDSAKEILITAPSPLGIAIFENVTNNQNVLVWNRIEGIAAWSFTFGDFDSDNKKEFVTAWLGSLGRVFVFENTADNQYELVIVDTVRLPNGADVFSGNDIDSDGKPEFFVGFARIVGGNIWDYFLYMWEATANNTYQRVLVDQIRGSDFSTLKSCCGDIDGDGVEELVWSIGGRVMVYKATGNNQFQRVWEWNNDHGGAPYYEGVVDVFDMNNNGYKEIVISGYGKTSIFEVEAIRLLRPNWYETFQGNTQELIRW